MLELYKYVETKDHQYSATPSLSHMFAMNYQLDRILAEGLEQRFGLVVVVAAVILGVFTSISDFSLYQVVDLFTSWAS